MISPKSDISRTQAEKEWLRLKKGIEEIQNGNASKLRFEELYRNAYTLVLHKHGHMLYNGVRETICARLRKIVSKVRNATNNLLVKTCTDEWNGHKVKMVMIRDILMYMDKTHCDIQRKVGVHDLGLQKFKEIVIMDANVLDRLKKEILNYIDRERQGQQIEIPLLRNCLLMFVEADKKTKKLYSEHFERQFLEQTRNFYKIESGSYLENNTVPDYLKKVEDRLKQEDERQENYLDLQTRDRLRSVCEKELIINHAVSLVSNPTTGCKYLYRETKITDVARMYSLFRRQPRCFVPLREALREYIVSEGLHSVNESRREPEKFVRKTLQMKKKFDRFFEQAFQRDSSFDKVIKSGFEEFVNKDIRPARYLSSHADSLLRTGFEKMNDTDTTQAMDDIITIFKYISDKDIFEDVYKQHLAQRLLHEKSQSDANEKTMLAKFKGECGHQFTSKMEGMFKDIEQSRYLRGEWRQFQEKRNMNDTIELNTSVLTSGFWPFSHAGTCNLPRQLLVRCELYEEFYTKTYQGRRIKFNTAMGTGEVLVNFPLGTKRLIVSTYQMCILAMFNENSKITYKEITDKTKIEQEELQRHLLSLAHPKVRVLCKDPNTKRLEDNHTFTLNTKYRNNKFRVRINLITKKQPRQQKGPSEEVMETRKNIIEATIVRIMKSRKQLPHSDLIQELIHQLSHRFTPPTNFIKKRIESLIEREYLERDGDNRKVYNYKA